MKEKKRKTPQKSKNKEKQRKQIEREKGKKKKRKTCRASLQRMWQTLEKNELKNKTPLLPINTEYLARRLAPRENNSQTGAQSTLQVAAAVSGTSSIITRSSLLVRLVP